MTLSSWCDNLIYLWVIEGCIRKVFLKKTHVETSHKMVFWSTSEIWEKTCWMFTTWLSYIFIQNRNPKLEKILTIL